MSLSDVKKAKAAHPDALLLVHPECVPAVTEQADLAGSTSDIINFAKKSDAKEFIIGTDAAADNEIIMSDELNAKARVCIDEMLRLGQ